MANKIVEFDKDINSPHEVAELICLGCRKRWIGVYRANLPLKDMECKCGRVGSIIKTGQTLFDEEANCDE